MKNSSTTGLWVGGVILALAIIVAGYFALRGPADVPGVSNSAQPSASASPSVSTPSTTRAYENADFSLVYPDILTATEKDGGATLMHSVPYSHQNPCDSKGTGKLLADITDFNVTIKMYHLSVADTVKATEPNATLQQTFASGVPELSPGYIEAYRAGSLTGYKVTSGVEGCGRYTYYLQVAPARTLFVSRAMVTEFNPIVADYLKYLAVPGIITPAQEEKYVNDILGSLQF